MIDKKYSGKAIGIDLGTSNSCVAIFESSNITVIPNGQGDRTTPSILFYKTEKDTPEVGINSKRQAIIYPEAVIYESKRLIGRSYASNEDAKMIEEHSKRIKYKISRQGDSPVITVKPKTGESFNIKFEEAASKILTALKKDAEAYLSCKVDAVVITVPSYFGDQQRQATRDAAEIAGFTVLRVINEPTAAALAYYKNNTDIEKNVAVYDLGGGTFDVSILQLSKGGLIEVKATHGDAFLGGADLDNAVFEYIQEKMGQNLPPSTMEKLQKNLSVMQKLRQCAEDAKKSLSHSFETTISPDLGFIDGQPVNFDIVMSRSELEKITEKIIRRTVPVCELALKDAKASGIHKIDEVILVGGMTRMPLVQSIVKEIFGTGAAIKKDLNPDEIVACGAAVQAGILSEQDSKTNILLSDVTPLSMGIETLGGVYTKMVERNTPVPTQASQVYTTAEDNQTEVHIRVFQGERPIATDNRLLGDFVLKGIKPAPRGKPQIEVTFHVDVNGMVNVTAKDKETGVEQTIQIQHSTSMDQKEKERLIREAEENSRRDASRLEISKGISAAESLIYDANSKLKEYGDKIDDNLRVEIEKNIEALSKPLSELKVKYSNPSTDPEGPIRDTLKDVQEKTAELMAAVTKASGYSNSNPTNEENHTDSQ